MNQINYLQLINNADVYSLSKSWFRLWPCPMRYSGSKQESQLTEHLSKLGYTYWEESNNPAYEMFLTRWIWVWWWKYI